MFLTEPIIDMITFLNYFLKFLEFSEVNFTSQKVIISTKSIVKTVLHISVSGLNLYFIILYTISFLDL